MLYVLSLAKLAATTGNVPLAAVVVDETDCIAAEIAGIRRSGPGAGNHPEHQAIEEALRARGRRNLNQCVLYTSVEPCAQCLALAAFTGLDRVVFGARAERVPATLKPYAASGRPPDGRPPLQGPLQENALLSVWQRMTAKS